MVKTKRSCKLVDSTQFCEKDYETEKELFEEAIEILTRLLAELNAIYISEVKEDMEEQDIVVAVLNPMNGEELTVMSDRECRTIFADEYQFDESEIIPEYEDLCIVYDSEHVVTLGECRYLVEAPMQIFNIDKDGNACSINPAICQSAMEFAMDTFTCIEVDGKVFHAFRLEP